MSLAHVLLEVFRHSSTDQADSLATLVLSLTFALSRAIHLGTSRGTENLPKKSRRGLRLCKWIWIC
eukprot:1161061-Pelagomonas_calceolata.AAC.5